MRRLCEILVGGTTLAHYSRWLCCSLRILWRVPESSCLEHVSRHVSFAYYSRPLALPAGRCRGAEISSALCLLDFLCLAARARHTVWCEPLTPSPLEAHLGSTLHAGDCLILEKGNRLPPERLQAIRAAVRR